MTTNSTTSCTSSLCRKDLLSSTYPGKLYLDMAILEEGKLVLPRAISLKWFLGALVSMSVCAASSASWVIGYAQSVESRIESAERAQTDLSNQIEKLDRKVSCLVCLAMKRGDCVSECS